MSGVPDGVPCRARGDSPGGICMDACRAHTVRRTRIRQNDDNGGNDDEANREEDTQYAAGFRNGVLTAPGSGTGGGGAAGSGDHSVVYRENRGTQRLAAGR